MCTVQYSHPIDRGGYVVWVGVLYSTAILLTALTSTEVSSIELVVLIATNVWTTESFRSDKNKMVINSLIRYKQ